MQVTVQAPAKINLTLDAVGLRRDGYHLLESIFQSVSVYDTLTLTPAKEGIRLDAPALCGATENNTAVKAARVFFAHTGIKDGVSLTLEKRIPTKAGMGGGSTDAAGVLLGLDCLFGTALSREELNALGETVGADVPFCLVGGTAFVTGIGEQVSPLSPLPDCSIVIAQPREGISTKEAYRALDSVSLTHRPDHKEALGALARGDLPGLCRQSVNVFEEATSLQGVARLREQMEAFSPLCSQMTGSGSAVFGIFASDKEAKACVQALKGTVPTAFVCHPCGGCRLTTE